MDRDPLFWLQCFLTYPYWPVCSLRWYWYATPNFVSKDDAKTFLWLGIVGLLEVAAIVYTIVALPWRAIIVALLVFFITEIYYVELALTCKRHAEFMRGRAQPPK